MHLAPPYLKALFFLAVLFSLSPWATPPLSLAAGLVFVQLFGHPYAAKNKAWTSNLLKIMVVGLGLGLPLEQVMETGRQGLGLSLVVLVFAFGLGYLLGRLLGLDAAIRHLISSGTAICGGSAIAAVAPLVPVDERGLSLSLGVVFLLNAAAVFIFPGLGQAFGLDAAEFGTWAALAIHDTSSVVGAASRFDQAMAWDLPAGQTALDWAVTTKLTRTLWIIPLSFVTAFAFRKKGHKKGFPWFILFFLMAVMLYHLVPAGRPVFLALAAAARRGLNLCLFLIGMGLSWPLIRSLGWKTFSFGMLLWLGISLLSLGLILWK